jgi:hypothetical protein
MIYALFVCSWFTNTQFEKTPNCQMTYIFRTLEECDKMKDIFESNYEAANAKYGLRIRQKFVCYSKEDWRPAE